MPQAVICDLHSSMERLKELDVLQLFYLICDLHSSMERLKGIIDKGEILEHNHLHSSMERLKVCGTYEITNVMDKFTFQYGEIKRPGCYSTRATRIYIYIPVWRD